HRGPAPDDAQVARQAGRRTGGHGLRRVDQRGRPGVGAAGAEHALVKRWRAKLCVACMLLVSMTNAQQPGYDASSSDSMTSAALRASLLGNEERAREIAQARLKWEQPRNVKPEFVISERLAILAESSRRWLPSDRIAKQQLG